MSKEYKSGRTIVIGIGNRYRGDDAAGVIAAERLSDLNDLKDVNIEVQNGEAARLIESWDPSDSVIIIDTIRSGRTPGTLERFDPLDTPLSSDDFRHFSTHSFGLADAIELANILGKLPSSLIVYGIEGKDFTSGTGLSADVMDGVNKAVESVKREIGKRRN